MADQGMRIYIEWNRLKWLLVAGGPLFFFIRAINLALTGNGCLGAMNLGYSWVLLFFEMAISGVAAIGGLVLWIKVPSSKDGRPWRTVDAKKLVLSIAISTYLLHFARVILWVAFCVI